MSERKQARYATARETVEIVRLLMAHCRTIDGMAVYDDGWSDREIAGHVSHDLPESCVVRLRLAQFGNVRLRSKMPEDTPQKQTSLLVMSRLQIIEAKIDDMAAQIAKLF